MKPDLLVLAAGSGTRFGGLKQLAPIGPAGEALLEYSVFDALRAGFGRVVLVVRAETETEFRRRLDHRMGQRVEVRYVHQRLDDLPAGPAAPVDRVEPWGTGHAVLVAAEAIDRPFAVVNADDFYGAEAFSRLGSFLAADGSALAAMGFRLEDTLSDSGPVSRAILETSRAGHLRRAVEYLEVWRDKPRVLARDSGGRVLELDAGAPTSMNMWGFRPRLFAALAERFGEFLRRPGVLAAGEFRLPEAIESLVAAGRFRVEVLPAAGEWCGLTFRQDHDRVRASISARIERGLYPPVLWDED